MIELHTDFRRNLIPRRNVPIYITSWTVCKHGLFGLLYAYVPNMGYMYIH